VSRDFDIIRLKIDKAALKTLDNRRRNQLVGSMHAHNELTVLNRLLMFSMNISERGEPYESAASYQIAKSLTRLPISQSRSDLVQVRRGEFDMTAPISLRGDFDGPMLRVLALSEKAGSVTRRLLALVTIYDGGTRADAARLGGVGQQTLRDWVLRFNAKGPDGLVDGKSTGRPSVLDDEQRRALVAMVEAGPNPAIHEVVRWRLIDLARWVFDEYGLSVTKQILSRELRALGYRKLSARPRHHEHDEAAVEALKKKSRTSWRIYPESLTTRRRA